MSSAGAVWLWCQDCQAGFGSNDRIARQVKDDFRANHPGHDVLYAEPLPTVVTEQ